MQQGDFERFGTVLTALSELYGKPLSQGAIALWWQALERFDFEQVSRAIRAHTEDAQSGQFMPKPADLIRVLEGTATQRASLAWGAVFDAMQRVGAYQDVVFDDATIHAVVDDLGGWPKLCRSSSSELSYLQHRFTESYRAYRGRQSFEYPRRLVGDRSSDEMYLRRGLPPPKPVVLGNVEQARLVYQGGVSGAKPLLTLADAAAAAVTALLDSPLKAKVA